MKKRTQKKRKIPFDDTEKGGPLPGTHVRVTEESALNGLEWNRKVLNHYLELGKTYIVKRTQVYEWDTQVYLEGFPSEVGFNSRNFVVISEEDL